MFANPRLSLKTAPVFVDSSRYASEGESIYVTGLRPAIMNDGDSPPKALIELDMFSIPMCDFQDGDTWLRTYYDLSASICMTPEDTIRLIRHLNYLLSELFKDHNHIVPTHGESIPYDDEEPKKSRSKKAKVKKK